MRLAGRVLLPLGLLVVLLALLALRGLAIDWTPLDVPVPLRTPVTYTFVPDSTATYELQVWFDRPAVGVRELPRAVDIQLEYTVAADSSTLTHANVVSPCVSLYGESLGTSVARFACRAGQKHILTVHHVTVGPALKPFHPRLSVSLDGSGARAMSSPASSCSSSPSSGPLWRYLGFYSSSPLFEGDRARPSMPSRPRIRPSHCP